MQTLKGEGAEQFLGRRRRAPPAEEAKLNEFKGILLSV